MFRFVTRLSMVFSLTMVSSCTLSIAQIQLPDNTYRTSASVKPKSQAEPLDALVVSDKPTVLVSEPEDTVVPEVICGQYSFPELESTPELPYIPPSRRSDDEYVSEKLVEHVNRLTSFIETAERELSASYERYLDNCR